MTPEELINMPLGHQMPLKNGVLILRVLGGWIYSYRDSMHTRIESSVFVPEPPLNPFNDEFEDD